MLPKKQHSLHLWYKGSPSKRCNQSCSRGFTLIEITIAIVILGSALVVLLGLQSSAVERTIRDRNMQKAMLMARRILASIETSDPSIELQDTEGEAAEVLDKVGVADRDDLTNENNENKALPLRAHLIVENWGIPDLNEEAMKRISLKISWSEAESDHFELVYFIPNEVPPPPPK